MANDADVEPFTKIPNLILERICLTRLPGEVGQVLMTIARLTYGYHKKKIEISLGLFHKMTGIERSNARRAINVLESMRIIFTDRTPGKKTFYRINPDVLEWQAIPKQRADKRQTVVSSDYSPELLSVSTTDAVSSDYSAVVSSDYSAIVSSDYSSYKKESFKERNKETHKESLCASDSFSFEKTATDFCEKIVEYHPKCKPESINLSAKILAGIGESPDEISRAIEFGFADTAFWRSNIKSAKQFAKNYDTIKSQMKRVKKVPVDKHKALIAHFAIEECKTIHELMTIWKQNPDYETSDVLKNERNHLLFQMASQRIENAETEFDLNDAFSEDEMFFTACVPSIATLFCEKMDALTGDHDWNLDSAEIIEMNDASSENEIELTGFE
jgi:phage replication O-like protein O